jgi:hypothetical protein
MGLSLMLQIPRTFWGVLVQVRGIFLEAADPTHLQEKARASAWDFL